MGCDFDNDGLKKGCDGVNVEGTAYTSFAIGIGEAGECGSVLRGKDKGFFIFPN